MRLVLLCVPDDAIAAAAAAIVPGPLVGHCSGASGLDMLGDTRGFQRAPADDGDAGGRRFRRCVGRDRGLDPAGGRSGQASRPRSGLRAVRVDEADRVAYHAAAAFAANFLITLEDAAAQLMSTAGLDREVLLPLARAALENWGRRGPSALTGPVARG